MRTLKVQATSVLVVACLLGVVLVAGRLTTDNPDDRVLTLATAWGSGTSAPGSAFMQWSIGSHFDHEMRGGGHWEKLVTARKGDHVVLQGTASNGDPLSCSISGPHGILARGSNRCEILGLP